MIPLTLKPDAAAVFCQSFSLHFAEAGPFSFVCGTSTSQSDQGTLDRKVLPGRINTQRTRPAQMLLQWKLRTQHLKPWQHLGIRQTATPAGFREKPGALILRIRDEREWPHRYSPTAT